ncbi:MAG: hypothetical protein NWF03_06755 [Candidatus Bathyarchaeota archaeon]|nr:hypothetical protein [Candidatus Bathyarchaeota archaeon]
MNFEDLENMKHDFTIYSMSEKPVSCSASKTFLVLRKKNTTYTRVVVTPPVYSAQHHFRLLIHYLLCKLRLKHA